MLDFTSREQTLGKPVGGDLKEGKVTLPARLCARKRNAGGAPAGRNRASATALTIPTSFAEIYAMVERRGGIQRTRERAQQFTDRARQMVAEFPDSPYQRALCMLTDLVTERDR